MATYAGSGPQDVDAWVPIGKINDFQSIDVVMFADDREFVSNAILVFGCVFG